MPPLNKEAVRRALVERLEKDLDILIQATKAAHEAATHEESKAEDQYDTRGLEAGYLAAAQAGRVKELENGLRTLRSFPLRNFNPKEGIAVGALIELLQEEQKLWIFLHTVGAGVIINLEKKSVSIVSPQSPLGTELVDRKAGDSFSLKIKSQQKDYEILSVG